MSNSSTTVFLSGTNGLPGRYGGWDPILASLSSYLCSRSLKCVVHTESSKRTQFSELHDNRVTLSYINLSANGLQSILFDFICLFSALLKKNSVCLLFGTSGGFFLPLFSFLGLKTIVNLDGQEWRRSKWPFFVRLFLYISDYLSIKSATYVVCDHPIIYERALSRRSAQYLRYIPYGIDHIAVPLQKDVDVILSELCLHNSHFFFSVCRIEPENNIHIILEAFSRSPNYSLVVVGNWNNSTYGEKLYSSYSEFNNISLLQPNYNPVFLNSLRLSCLAYIHGHTVGGTNPSLLEAVALGCRIIHHDNAFNRYVAPSDSLQFVDCDSLIRALNTSASTTQTSHCRTSIIDSIPAEYHWDSVNQSYYDLICSALS